MAVSASLWAAMLAAMTPATAAAIPATVAGAVGAGATGAGAAGAIGAGAAGAIGAGATGAGAAGAIGAGATGAGAAGAGTTVMPGLLEAGADMFAGGNGLGVLHAGGGAVLPNAAGMGQMGQFALGAPSMAYAPATPSGALASTGPTLGQQAWGAASHMAKPLFGMGMQMAQPRGGPPPPPAPPSLRPAPSMMTPVDFRSRSINQLPVASLGRGLYLR